MQDRFDIIGQKMIIGQKRRIEIFDGEVVKRHAAFQIGAFIMQNPRIVNNNVAFPSKIRSPVNFYVRRAPADILQLQMIFMRKFCSFKGLSEKFLLL